MAITPVQPNIENTKSKVSYREAEGPIKTSEYKKPLPAQGHLVHDTLLSVPKFWVKDIAYDLKAVRDGFKGEANDHQTGRLNDVGLKIGGIGIAAYLASRTTDPKARLMEYVGLGTFLTAMSLYPKIAINTPSRAVHGFDIGKEYIDDQGRKKSVFQDSNYIPFDMYRGEYLDEDLDVIGDRMGIPRNIHNRHDLIKEQMRKIATQNNTLWMLTAGFATPVMTALICCGFEKLITPALNASRNAMYNKKIENALKATSNMTLNVSDIESNGLSAKVESFLEQYKGKEIPQTEIDKLTELFSSELDDYMVKGIKEDLNNIFKTPNKGYAIGDNTADALISTIKENLSSRNKATLEKVFVPTKEEINNILSKVKTNSGELTSEQMMELKGELKKLFGLKIEKEADAEMRKFLKATQNNILERISLNIKSTPATLVSEETYKQLVDFARIIGDFKSKDNIIDKCKSFKVEHAPETVLARYYSKFENTLLDVLDISYKDLKLMREPGSATKRIFDEKMSALAQNEEKYKEAISKLAKVMSEMELTLHGSMPNASYIKDLITAIENNYNNTARRLNAVSKDKFKGTIEALVKEDVAKLSNSVNSREEVFKLLDGTLTPKNLQGLDYVQEMAKGVGSSKRAAITKIIERYQGVQNSFNRILHTMDFYKRGIPGEGYAREVYEKGKENGCQRRIFPGSRQRRRGLGERCIPRLYEPDRTCDNRHGKRRICL